MPLATASIVCDSAVDMAIGSDSGVDDHTVKLPLPVEPSVWTR